MTFTLEFANLHKKLLEQPKLIPFGKTETQSAKKAQAAMLESTAAATLAEHYNTKLIQRSFAISLTQGQWDAVDMLRNMTAQTMPGAVKSTLLVALTKEGYLDRMGNLKPAAGAKPMGRPRIHPKPMTLPEIQLEIDNPLLLVPNHAEIAQMFEELLDLNLMPDARWWSSTLLAYNRDAGAPIADHVAERMGEILNTYIRTMFYTVNPNRTQPLLPSARQIE